MKEIPDYMHPDLVKKRIEIYGYDPALIIEYKRKPKSKVKDLVEED